MTGMLDKPSRLFILMCHHSNKTPVKHVQSLQEFASDGVVREAENDCGRSGLSKGKEAVCDKTKIIVIPEEENK